MINRLRNKNIQFRSRPKNNILSLRQNTSFNSFIRWSLFCVPLLIITAETILFYQLIKVYALYITIFILIINVPFNVFWFRRDREISLQSLSVYVTIMILNISAIPTYSVYNEIQKIAENKVVYTVGFRSWATYAEISNIEVEYYDEYGNPQRLTEDVIYDENTWTGALWTSHNWKNNLKDPALIKINTLEKKILLRNCATIIKPEIFGEKVFRNFLVRAQFKLLSVDPSLKKESNKDTYKDYYSTQICLRVPVNEKDYSWENYMAFEFFYNNFTWSKLRIPGLSYDYLSEALYKKQGSASNIKYIKENILNINDTKVQINSSIRLSAFLYNNYCLFNITNLRYGDNAQLFDFTIPENAPLSSGILKDSNLNKESTHSIK